MSLLQRAAQTFAKRSVADHCMQVARWLHTGLATTISRKSWHLLSKHRAYTIAPLALLRVHFKIGYLSTEQSDRKKPCAATDVQGQTVRDWEWHVNQVMPTFFCTSGGAVCAGYAQVTLVELRVSYRSGCDTRRKRKERQTKTQTKNTPAKNKRNL